MNGKFYIIFVIIFSLTLSCTRKYNSPQEFKGKMLSIGSGGGFSGRIIQYSLLENGQLFQVENDTTFLNLGILDIKQIDQMFLNYSNFKLNEFQINEPGNRYYFIIDNLGSKKHKLTWGRDQLKAPILELFYRNTMDMIEKQITKVKNN